MDALRIENLRSFEDTGFIELKPITLLLGQNSSGKSTFLRCFPLFRQSVEARTTGPILWYGRFVDFGSFTEAIRSNDQSDYIRFHFQFAISRRFLEQRLYSIRSKGGSDKISIELSLKITGDDNQGTSKVAEITIKFASEHVIIVRFDQSGKVSGFIVNNNDFSSINNRYQGDFQKYGMIPTISELQTDDPEQMSELLFPFRRRVIDDYTLEYIKRFAHRNTKNDNLVRLINSIRIGSSQDMLDSMKSNNYAPQSWRDNINPWSTNDGDFRHIRDAIIAISVPNLLMALDEYIVDFMRNSRYIAPLRATAERYYRLQNLAVDELDSQGQNLAMFLRNLNYNELKNFQNWTQHNFGFIPEVSASSGHVSLKIQETGSVKQFNLADKGFGFSQILPILTQLWVLVYQNSRNSPHYAARRPLIPITFTIEQPELHLHPHLQAQLIDAFLESVNAARKIGVELRLIIETHSETIVNRVGHRIANGDFDSEEVNIILFEKARPDTPTVIRRSNYDKNGFLTNWPFGFFEPKEA